MKPLDALGNLSGNQVLVRLKNGTEIRGTLKAFDIHINLVLENAEFEDGDVSKKFKTIFLRGDMILFVSQRKSVIRQWEKEHQASGKGEKGTPTSNAQDAVKQLSTTGKKSAPAADTGEAARLKRNKKEYMNQ